MSANEIVMVTHADTDNGFTIAHNLLTAGYRVVAIAQYPASLSRILLGRNADHVMAIAADIENTTQRDRAMQRARARFGAPVTRILDGRNTVASRSRSLLIAS